MKIKTRIYLTVLTGFFCHLFFWIYKLLYSPITGLATAQTLNENVSQYVIAKFIRDGGIEYFLTWIFMFTFIIIWISPIYDYIRTINSNPHDKK